MPVSINSLDANALAQLAAQKVGFLNLPLADKSPMGSLFAGQADSLFKNAELQQQYAQMENEMKRAQLQSDTQYGVGAQSAMAQATIAQYQAQQQAQQAALNRQGQMEVAGINAGAQDRRTEILDANNRAKLGLEESQLGVNQQNADSNSDRNKVDREKMLHDAAIQEIKARAELADKDLDHRQLVGNTMLYTLNDPQYADNPEALDQVLNTKAARAVKIGVMSKAEGERFAAMSLEEKKAAIEFDAGLSNSAAAYKDHISNKDKESKEEISAAKGETELMKIAENLYGAASSVDPEVFTFEGKTDAKIGNALENSPKFIQKVAGYLPKSLVDPERAAKYDSEKDKIKYATEQAVDRYFQIANKKGKMNEYLISRVKKYMPTDDDSPDDYASKTKSILKLIKQDVVSDMETQGKSAKEIKIITDKLDSWDSEVGNHFTAQKAVIPTQIYKAADGAEWSGQQILNSAKKYGISPEAVKKQIGAK